MLQSAASDAVSQGDYRSYNKGREYSLPSAVAKKWEEEGLCTIRKQPPKREKAIKKPDETS